MVIVKFRDLVNELREQNQDLQTQLMRESASKDEVRSSIPEMLDFKVNYKLKYLSYEKIIKSILFIRKCLLKLKLIVEQ